MWLGGFDALTMSGSGARGGLAGFFLQEVLEDDSGGFGVDIALLVAFFTVFDAFLVFEQNKIFDQESVNCAGEVFLEVARKLAHIATLLSFLTLAIARETNHEAVDVPGAGERSDFLELATVNFDGAIGDGDANFRVGFGYTDTFRADIEGD